MLKCALCQAELGDRELGRHTRAGTIKLVAVCRDHLPTDPRTRAVEITKLASKEDADVTIRDRTS